MSGRARLVLVLAAAYVLGTAPAHPQPVEGFVDLHSHLAARLAYGGGWFWGFPEGPESSALRRCDGNLFKTHGATLIPGVAELIGQGYGSSGDTGWHLGKRNGYDARQCAKFLWFNIPGSCPQPHYKDWPRWDTLAHEQMWSGWLQEAHRGGLRVLGVSLVESNFLCRNTARQTRFFGCDEMESVYRQATYMRNYAVRNGAWMGIATTSAQARELIRQGKLAVVLTVEVTKLFPMPVVDYVAQLDALRAYGVVSVQLAHHADNRFSGAAPIQEAMKAAETIEGLGFLPEELGLDLTDIDDIVCADASGTPAKCDGNTRLNVQGLTEDGRGLVAAMMDRGMLLDVAHVSRKTFREVYRTALQRGGYPLFSSHAHMWDRINPHPDHPRHEKYIQESEISMIRGTGGMIGLRPGPETAVAHPGADPVENRCDGSSRSFAQSLMYAVDRGLNVGFGADLNGVIKQLKPRYDCYTERAEILAAGGPTRLQRHGMGHIGMLPELVDDLRAIGVADRYVNTLNRSAEDFLRMWERSERASGPPPGINLALQAWASASDTYCGIGGEHCYSPSRINDGNRDATLGGYHSWANLGGLPAWVELTWPAPVKVSRVDLYTTGGYELRDYRIEYWDGSQWQSRPELQGSGNTNVYRSHVVDPSIQIQTHRLRVLGLSGPTHQTKHVRVNELEVY